MRIVVDGMGGDNAPKAVVGGVVEAIKEYNVEIVVTGDKDLLEKEFSNYEFDRSKLEIVHTTEIIENEDKPVQAIRRKKDSSMVVGLNIVKEKKAEENKEFPPSAPPKGKEEERKEDSASLQIPGYAFNTMTHNYPGLTDTLQRLGINEVSEVNAILRLSDYGRKGTTVWRLIANTCWSDIGAKGRYLIAALNKAKRK